MKRQIIIGPDTRIVKLGGRPPRVVTWLLVQQVGFFLVYAFADGPAWVALYLAASAEQTLGLLQVWQPLSAVWIHLFARDLLFNALCLWLFGAALERWWGSRRFFIFWVVTGVVGLVVGVLFGMLLPAARLAGSSGAALAMVLACSFIFPRHLVSLYQVIPVRARLLCLLLASFLVVGNIFSQAFLTVAVQLGGAAVSLLFIFPLGRSWGALRLRRAKKKFGVVEGGKKDKRYLN